MYPNTKPIAHLNFDEAAELILFRSKDSCILKVSFSCKKI